MDSAAEALDSCALDLSLEIVAHRCVYDRYQVLNPMLTTLIARPVGAAPELFTVVKAVKQASVNAVSMFLRAVAPPLLSRQLSQQRFRLTQYVEEQAV